MLHRENICPHVMLSGMNQPKALVYNQCVIHNLPKEGPLCMRFLAELTKSRPHSIVYRGESMTGLSQMVFDSLCTVDARIPPSYLERQSVLNRCHNQCESCGDPVAEIDHHVPRTCFGKDETSNYRALCAQCHKFKTTSDQNRMQVEDANPFLSRFNAQTWQGFVCSRRPHQVTACGLHEPSDGKVMECDIRNCRYNAIVECNNQDIPCFSVLDEIRPVTSYHLSDYMFVEVPSTRVRSPLSSYVWDGPRWYSKAACQYMLEFRICTWEDFKFSLDATSHRSHKELSAPSFHERGLDTDWHFLPRRDLLW